MTGMRNEDLVKKAFPNRPWYTVRCVFFDKQNKMFEETFKIFEANTEEEALKKADSAAKEVCESLGCYEYTGYAETFNLFEAKFKDGLEVFSIMRNANLSYEEYIQRFVQTNHDTGIKPDLPQLEEY